MYISEYTDIPPRERRQLFYKRRYKVEHSDWDDSMVTLVDWLRAEHLQGARLLDIGCGHGNFVVDELASIWGEKVGFDIDTEATKGNISMTRVVYGAPGVLPFELASFDVVTTLWVLEHVQDPTLFVSEIARVLKPGGRWAFVTPNANACLVNLRSLLHDGVAGWLVEKLYDRQEKDSFPVFYRLNTQECLEAHAKLHGLEVKKFKQNADPSYTSFGELSYKLSIACVKAGGSRALPHLVGIFQKQ